MKIGHWEFDDETYEVSWVEKNGNKISLGDAVGGILERILEVLEPLEPYKIDVVVSINIKGLDPNNNSNNFEVRLLPE